MPARAPEHVFGINLEHLLGRNWQVYWIDGELLEAILVSQARQGVPLRYLHVWMDQFGMFQQVSIEKPSASDSTIR